MGTVNDWKMLKKKCMYFDRYGCAKWLNQLIPIINKFILCYENEEIDKEFW